MVPVPPLRERTPWVQRDPLYFSVPCTWLNIEQLRDVAHGIDLYSSSRLPADPLWLTRREKALVCSQIHVSHSHVVLPLSLGEAVPAAPTALPTPISLSGSCSFCRPLPKFTSSRKPSLPEPLTWVGWEPQLCAPVTPSLPLAECLVPHVVSLCHQLRGQCM